MSTRISLFSSPFLLGFDHLERSLERVAKASDGYPPYNIEQLSETRLRITLAVAGFSLDDLCVQAEDNQLIIRGKHPECPEDRVYLHRGIAARPFQRCFMLAEGILIAEATLDNGLLHIDLDRPIPQPKVTNVPIHKGPSTPLSKAIEEARRDKL
ncbi:MAG: Hsp20 family protein [Alphaproteobacteria bacterium]|nr:MAG: Hsp20 family protein [Alphaproteobacteria bacterium]